MEKKFKYITEVSEAGTGRKIIVGRAKYSKTEALERIKRLKSAQRAGHINPTIRLKRVRA